MIVAKVVQYLRQDRTNWKNQQTWQRMTKTLNDVESFVKN